jgi:hypothetical protein
VPVQGCTLLYLSDCTRVHFTLPQCLYNGAPNLTSVPVQGALYHLRKSLKFRNFISVETVELRKQFDALFVFKVLLVYL